MDTLNEDKMIMDNKYWVKVQMESMNKEYWINVRTEAKNLKALIEKQNLKRIDFVKNHGKTLLKAYKHRWVGGIEDLVDDVSANSVSTIIRNYRKA